MLTLRSLLALPVFLSTTIISHALAAPGGYIDENKGPNVDWAAQLTGGEECDDKDLKRIRDGFAEMNMLFASAQDPDFTQEAEIEFFGRQNRISNYTDMIEGNLRRAAQYANLKGNMTRNPDIHVRCDDPNDMCDEGNKKEGKHAAYNIGNEPHINFCDKYFDLDPLDEQVDDEADEERTKMDLMNYYNRATAWARMVMHISGVGSAVVMKPIADTQSNSTSEWRVEAHQGAMNTSVLAGVMDAHPDTNGPNNIRVLKYAYGVTRAKLLATLSTQTAYDAANNAENYALYAQARYVMARKNFFPNMPIMNFGNDMAVLTNGQIQDGDRKKFACFEMPDVMPLKQGMNPLGGPLSAGSSVVVPWGTSGVILIYLMVSLGMSALS